jgi:glutathione S-transferase
MSTSSLKPLLLHAHSTGPNPYKVAILLQALDVAYTVKLWDFSSSSSGVKGEAFTAINPNGRVPALYDPNTGVTSWESLACINYVLRVYDTGKKFGPKDEEGGQRGRVEFEAWISFLVSTLGPMMGQCNWFRHYHDEKNEDAYKRYEAQVYRCFGVLEGQIKGHGGEWVLGGEGPSAVDYHFEPWMRQVGFAGLSLESYPVLKGWVERAQGLAEVVRAYESVKEGEEAK